MLINDIRINADFIWQLLMEKERLSIRQIQELTGFQEGIIQLTLGWLAKEDKIQFYQIEDAIYIKLSEIFQERFY